MKLGQTKLGTPQPSRTVTDVTYRTSILGRLFTISWAQQKIVIKGVDDSSDDGDLHGPNYIEFEKILALLEHGAALFEAASAERRTPVDPPIEPQIKRVKPSPYNGSTSSTPPEPEKSEKPANTPVEEVAEAQENSEDAIKEEPVKKKRRGRPKGSKNTVKTKSILPDSLQEGLKEIDIAAEDKKILEEKAQAVEDALVKVEEARAPKEKVDDTKLPSREDVLAQYDRKKPVGEYSPGDRYGEYKVLHATVEESAHGEVWALTLENGDSVILDVNGQEIEYFIVDTTMSIPGVTDTTPETRGHKEELNASKEEIEEIEEEFEIPPEKFMGKINFSKLVFWLAANVDGHDPVNPEKLLKHLLFLQEKGSETLQGLSEAKIRTRLNNAMSALENN